MKDRKNFSFEFPLIVKSERNGKSVITNHGTLLVSGVMEHYGNEIHAVDIDEVLLKDVDNGTDILPAMRAIQEAADQHCEGLLQGQAQELCDRMHNPFYNPENVGNYPQ